MNATILALDTEVPQIRQSQEDYAVITARLLGLNDKKTNLLQRIVVGSQIQYRHLVMFDLLEKLSESSFDRPESHPILPKTAERNQLYKEEAPKLAKRVSKKVLEAWGGDPKEITHVISVSCTGMIAPGIEFLLIEQLGLSPQVERLGINFMGCFGAFKGLTIAKALAKENAKHRVLVVCTELCSLHFQDDFNVDTMVANSIFADGAAAAIVGIEPRSSERPLFEIHNQGSAALQHTASVMSWEAGNQGYKMRLCPSVPEHLKANVAPFAQRIIAPNLHFDDCAWAVHPGGAAILKAIQEVCSLGNEQLAASWKVLAQYGNMSSPTFLFVLKEVINTPSAKEWVVGLGFGPGLSIEGLLLKRLGINVAE